MGNNPRDTRALERIAVEVKRIRMAIEREPRFIKCSTLLSRKDFERMKEELKEQNENIILLPPGADLCGCEDERGDND
jgi:hypothetical protein